MNVINNIEKKNNLEIVSKDKDMNTKEDLVLAIKEWLKNDNEIKILQKEIKDRKIRNQIISKNLINTMKENEIDRIDINSGNILFTKKNIKKPITQKFLLNLLTQYYKNNDIVAQEITDYIISNREIKTTEHIIHKQIKQK